MSFSAFSFLTYRRGELIHKGAEPKQGSYSVEADWLLALADKVAPSVRAAFIAAAKSLGELPSEKALQALIAQQDYAGVLRLMNVEPTMDKILRGGFTSMLADLLGTVGVTALERLPSKVFIEKPPTRAILEGVFNIRNPRVSRFLDNYHASMVKGISTDTGRGIAAVVQRAFQEGGHPREQARTIRNLIGLLPRQEASLARYRETLSGAGRDPEQVERMSEKYRKQLLTARAETIARTETIRAANAGAEMAWQEAEETGLIAPGQKRRWVVTKDDRLCIYCAAIPGMNKGGVALSLPFQSPKGPVTAPPLHPRCRCAVSLIIRL